MQQNNHEEAADSFIWTGHVDEEGVLTLPDELWERLGWQEGDVIEFDTQEDGSLLLYKVKEDHVEEHQGQVDSQTLS